MLILEIILKKFLTLCKLGFPNQQNRTHDHLKMAKKASDQASDQEGRNPEKKIILRTIGEGLSNDEKPK